MKWSFRLPALARTYRHVVRLREILDVLITEGFGTVVVRMNLNQLVRFTGRLRRYVAAAPTPLTLPQHLRRLLEQLGPTFIKLGQMLASRPDLLPPSFITELQALHDHAAAEPFERVRPILEKELRGPLGDVFAYFDEEPLAAASLAQVYAARLPSGADVVVKVQRPQIDEKIRTDLEIINQYAGTLAERFPQLRPLNPVALVEELSLAIKRELDFSTEAGSTERLRRNLEAAGEWRVPRVYWEFTTERLLVLERIRGIRCDDLASLRAARVDLKKLARSLVECFLTQVFKDGFYHADPHAGNILVSENGQVQLLDCGAMGYLTTETLNALGAILIAFNTRDYARISTEVIRLGAADEIINISRFKADAAAVVGRYYAMPLRYMRLGGFFEELAILANRNGVRLPRELILLAKTVMLVENLARGMDPDLELITIAEPFARDLVKKRYSPLVLARDFADGAHDLNYYLREIPRDFALLMKRLVRGGMKIELEHHDLAHPLRELDRSSNRLSFSLIVASVIVSSALIFVAGVGPHVLGYPVLGLGGFVLAAFLGLWLAVAMLRSGRL